MKGKRQTTKQSKTPPAKTNLGIPAPDASERRREVLDDGSVIIYHKAGGWMHYDKTGIPFGWGEPKTPYIVDPNFGEDNAKTRRFRAQFKAALRKLERDHKPVAQKT